VRCGLEHLAEEPFGGPRVSFRAQHEIDRLSRRIDGAVEILPLTFDFDVGLINAVGVGVQSQVRTNSFLQLRSIRLNPPVNRRVIEREAAFVHHLFEIAIAESITQIPAYAEKDDLGLIVPPFERIGVGQSSPQR